MTTVTSARQVVPGAGGDHNRYLRSSSRLAFACSMLIAPALVPVVLVSIFYRELFSQGEGGGPTKAQRLTQEAKRRSLRYTSYPNSRGWNWVD